MYSIEVERTMVRSPHELWDKLCARPGLARWLADVHVQTLQPPNRIEWSFRGASGVIELEASRWGTTVRARVKSAQLPAWERLAARYEMERALRELFADLGASSLQGR